MTISEKDLAFNDLRSYLIEKLEGFEYHTVNFLQVKVMALEFKLKNAKDNFKPHRSNTHILDHDSDSSDDDSKEVYVLSLFGHQRPNPVQFRLSSRFKRIGKRS